MEVDHLGGSARPMGRTVATWRARIERRVEAWGPFRRVLRPRDKVAFRRMLHAARSRAAAGGMIPAVDPMEPILLAMLVEAYDRIARLEEALQNGEDTDE